MSSAILYGAIVVIWAGVLIPRWLRRESSAESSTGEATVTTDVVLDVSASSDADQDPVFADEDAPADGGGQGKSERARILGARRRLLGMLVALAFGSGLLFVMKLAAWWVVLPPSVMLVGYLALLREASRADAERLAARRARDAAAARAASGGGAVVPSVPDASPVPVPVGVSVPGPDAEVIDITERVSEEFYDQYADSRRAVGD